MQLRLVASVLALAFLAAGCFSSGLSVRQEAITLYSESELTADGPALQEVTVRAFRGGDPVALDGLEVIGRTADGSPVEVDWAQTAYAPGDEGSPVETASAPEGALTFQVDVHDLVRRGVVELELALHQSVLVLPIRPSTGATPSGEDAVPASGPEAREALGYGADDLWAGEGALVADVVAGEDVDVEVELDEREAFEWDSDREPEPESGYDDGAEDPSESVTALAPAPQIRQTRVLRRGTSQATPVYIIRSANPGPTVMIVGGMHGSETAGWRAAGEIKDWTIDRGTLVVIPQANRPAVLRSRRTGPDGIDLNRQFPVNGTPRTALAREIWNLVQEFRPVALVDLHEGWGLRRLGHRFPGGTLSVGQTLITYPAKDARSFALHATRYVDSRHVGPSRIYSFLVIGPPIAGSLARKAGAELNIPAFIVEPTQYQTTVETRVRWHKAFVEQLLKWYGLVDKNRTLVAPRYPRASLSVFDETGAPGAVASAERRLAA